jgi:hypothetical protein
MAQRRKMAVRLRTRLVIWNGTAAANSFARDGMVLEDRERSRFDGQ